MKKEGEEQPQGNPPANYMKYFGLAFQMCAIIGLGTWAGFKVQERSAMNFPVWVLLFCFFSIFVSFYQLFKSLKNDERNSGGKSDTKP